jgi:hypothetical protein
MVPYISLLAVHHGCGIAEKLRARGCLISLSYDTGECVEKRFTFRTSFRHLIRPCWRKGVGSEDSFVASAVNLMPVPLLDLGS